MPSFKSKFCLRFIMSCYVIFSLSMVQAIDIPRENCNLKLPIVLVSLEVQMSYNNNDNDSINNNYSNIIVVWLV